jgi:membrane protein implicated in regulation of membrane protease activity
MSSWLLWAIITVAFIVGELHTNSFYLAPFAIGGAVATILAAIGVGAVIPVFAFAGSGALFLVALRPIAMRHRHSLPLLRTGAAALVGQSAVVMQGINNRESTGTIKLGGEIWTARAYDGDSVFAAGEDVQVIEIKGATALVLH